MVFGALIRENERSMEWLKNRTSGEKCYPFTVYRGYSDTFYSSHGDPIRAVYFEGPWIVYMVLKYIVWRKYTTCLSAKQLGGDLS